MFVRTVRILGRWRERLLYACKKLIGALIGTPIAVFLTQHLGPTHESMMVDLLFGFTCMTARQAALIVTCSPFRRFGAEMMRLISS